MKKFLVAVVLARCWLPPARFGAVSVALDGSLRPEFPGAEARPGRALHRAAMPRSGCAADQHHHGRGSSAGMVTGHTWMRFDLQPRLYDFRACRNDGKQ